MSTQPEIQKGKEAPKESSKSVQRRERTGSTEIVGKVARIMTESGESAEGEAIGTERVSEVASEQAGEQGGSGAQFKTGQQGDDDDSTQTGGSFVFDDQNLPAQDAMIRLIEKEIRQDIRRLEKEANRYRGNIFRSPDFQKFNDTVTEIRRKRRLLSELATMAMEALKTLYISLFKPKEVND